MKPFLYKIIALVLCLCTLPMIPLKSQATEANAAEDITKSTAISVSGYSSGDFLTDGNKKYYKSSDSAGATITLTNESGMAGIYLMFDLEYGEYTITENASGKTYTAGKGQFLHEYIDLAAAFGAAPTAVTISFASGSVRLSELSVFSAGTLPDFVQVWSAPLDGKADIVLFATHGDDDQLYFAGLLPYYSTARDCAVQVVYLTDHRNLTNTRTHEMLNGLWSVGITAYPVFGRFADFRIDSLQGTYDEYRYSYNTSKDDLMRFVVENIRRFKPQVAVGHDLNGEYGHGMHQVYASLLTEALDITNDATQYPESATKYGVWDIPKLYLHLYEENPIVIDYDVPLEAFGGMTAFQVTQNYGFPCHESQQGFMFTPWLYGYSREITSATQIATYNPAKFGLYRSLVGEDVAKNDFMENIVTYAEQERLEQERLEQERLEQERLEQERLEQERLEQERLEQERLEAERLEKERLEAEKAAAEAKKKLEITVAVVILVVLVGALVAALFLLNRKKRHPRKK